MKHYPQAINMSRCIPLQVLHLIFLGIFNYAAPISASAQGITCGVTKLDNQTTYHLSVGPTSPDCLYSWEDANGTVLLTEGDHDTNRVAHHDTHSLTVPGCLDWLKYNLDCLSTMGMAVCITNCSAETPQDVVQNASIKHATLVIACSSGALLASLGLVLYCCKGRIRRAYKKVCERAFECKTKSPTDSYVQVKMTEEGIV